MKNLLKLSIISILFIIFSNNTFADLSSVPITGIAYSDKIGILHFDYTTAIKPATPLDDSYYIGDTKQFYIKFTDAKYPEYSDAEKDGLVASIDTDNCGSTYCYLKGFVWSDTIGWIALDGDIINSFIEDAEIAKLEESGMNHEDASNKIASEKDGINDPYTSSMYPAILNSGENAGALVGYAWNKDAGWIKFSKTEEGSRVSSKEQRFSNNWGAWLDLDVQNNEVYDNNTPDNFDDILLGRKFYGFILSEKLGWIKFSKDDDDNSSFEFAVRSVWMPDTTPPQVLANNNAWFAIGVNSGYDENIPSKSLPSTITWPDFIIDNNSGIQIKGTKLFVKKDNSSNVNCLETEISGLRNGVSSNNYFTSSDFLIPNIGKIGEKNASVEEGYCKYNITGVVYNNVNMPTYLGDKCFEASNPCNLPSGTTKPNNGELGKQDAVSFYVRAGDLVAPDTLAYNFENNINDLSKNISIADDSNVLTYNIFVYDVAKNPIVPVNPSCEGCPKRQFALTSNIVNNTLYDLTEDLANQSYVEDGVIKYNTPVKFLNDDHGTGEVLNIGKIDNTNDIFTSNVKDYQYLGNNNDEYTWRLKTNCNSDAICNLKFKSKAPTSTYDLDSKLEKNIPLYIKSVDYLSQNEELPSLSKKMKLDESGLPIIDNETDLPILEDDSSTTIEAYNEPNKNDLTPGNLAQFNSTDTTYISFLAAIKTKSAELVNQGDDDYAALLIGKPSKIKYNVQSIANNPIKDVSIDNIFDYNSTNPSIALMETHRISSNYGNKDKYAWTDPFNIETRYELYNGQGSLDSDADGTLDDISSSTSPFRGKFPFNFDWNLEYKDIDDSWFNKNKSIYSLPEKNIGIRYDGTYVVTGRESIPKEFPYLGPVNSLNNSKPLKPEDPYNYASGEIKRSDKNTNLNFVRASYKTPVSLSNDIEIEFTPEKLASVSIKDIEFNLINQIAYKNTGDLLFTKYTMKPSLDNPASVADIAFDSVGTVKTNTLATDRKFSIIGSDKNTKKLQETIRRNVAEYVSSIKNPCKIKESIIFDQVKFDSLKNNKCAFYDNINNTLFVYYKGDKNTELVIKDTNDIKLPNMPVTIVLDGGANLFIKSNIYYDTDSSFGLILIADKIGEGSNLYVSPVPTNISAIAYVEGSVLSRKADSTLPLEDNDLYYGAGSSSSELSNQLYWQGSIASRNTIAGAGQEKIPEGISCLEGDTRLECAQRYDFDYLRRFTVVNKGSKTYILNDANFSGGGSCPKGSCSIPNNSLDTLISLSGDKIDLDNSEIAPFYLNIDVRSSSNPPPAFYKSSELNSSQVIR